MGEFSGVAEDSLWARMSTSPAPTTLPTMHDQVGNDDLKNSGFQTWGEVIGDLGGGFIFFKKYFYPLEK